MVRYMTNVKQLSLSLLENRSPECALSLVYCNVDINGLSLELVQSLRVEQENKTVSFQNGKSCYVSTCMICITVTIQCPSIIRNLCAY